MQNCAKMTTGRICQHDLWDLVTLQFTYTTHEFSKPNKRCSINAFVSL